VKVALNTLY